MEDLQRKSSDLGYFTMARGIGILMVVAGHTVNAFLTKPDIAAPALFSSAGNVFGGGLMAMFFLISGFGFYRRSPKKCLLIQSRLLLPYCLVAAAVLLTKLGLAVVKRRSFWEHGGEYILTYLLGLNAEGGGTLWGLPVESVSIFWFVLALFGGWVLYNGIVQLKSPVLQWLLVGGCVLAAWLLTLISSVWPFCLPIALLAVGYLAAGAQIRKHRLLERRLPAWSYLLVGAPVLVSAAWGDVNIVACVWRLGLLDMAGTFCLGFLLLRLYAQVMKHNPHGRLVLLLEAVGFHSIWVVCLHAYEKVIFPWYQLGRAFPELPGLCILLCFAGRCGVIYLLYRLICCANRLWAKKHRRKTVKIELE